MKIYAIVRQEPYEPDAYVAYYKDEEKANEAAKERNLSMPDRYFRYGTEYVVEPIEVVE